jgi:hypothetical protein
MSTQFTLASLFFSSCSFPLSASIAKISVFDLEHNGLVQRARVGSGGMQPTNLTVRGDSLYVLNAGGNGNVVGFDAGPSGDLSMFSGSSRALSRNAWLSAAELPTPPRSKVACGLSQPRATP